MAILSGTAGLNFNIVESGSTSVTGTITQTYEVSTTIGSVSVTTSNAAVALYGYVGANSYQLNLKNISNVSGAGTGIAVVVSRNQAVAANTLKYIIIHNADSTNNLVVAKGATSSFIAATDQYTLKPGMGLGLAYSNAETVGATSSVMSIVGSAGSTFHEVFCIYG